MSQSQTRQHPGNDPDSDPDPGSSLSCNAHTWYGPAPHRDPISLPQAAAHGVPTVATRNGGPVDIMKTLHHGVVVDPTDEKAVAEALLDILTHPTKWEEMSKNGA